MAPDSGHLWIPGQDRQIAGGGLMRCCIQTIARCEDETVVGTVLRCAAGGHSEMRVEADGAWHWVPPYDGA